MNTSEAAALAWITGGAIGTVVVQRLTDGEHSVSDGLRAHPIATTVLAVAFACHLARRPRCLACVDPFHLLGLIARGKR